MINPQIVAVQQSGCPAKATNGTPATSITTLFPGDLPVDLTGTLAVLDGTATVAEFPFRALSDNLHFLNSCDNTLIRVSIFAIAPNPNECSPNIIQGSALVSADHCCPVRSPIDSVVWRGRVNRFGSSLLEVPVKWAFSRTE